MAKLRVVSLVCNLSRLTPLSGGNNRLRLPKPIEAYHGFKSASSFGPACPQHGMTPVKFPPGVSTSLPGLTDYPEIKDVSEDCTLLFSSTIVFPELGKGLYLNVFKPTTANEGDNLPVVVVRLCLAGLLTN
jgi:carboxylesterase type B